MSGRLDGRVAIVTGATRGIGKETALLLAREGPVVAVVGRDRVMAESVTAEVEQAGGRAVACLADLARWEGVKAVSDRAFREFGGVDVLVCNAGRSFSSFQSR